MRSRVGIRPMPLAIACACSLVALFTVRVSLLPSSRLGINVFFEELAFGTPPPFVHRRNASLQTVAVPVEEAFPADASRDRVWSLPVSATVQRGHDSPYDWTDVDLSRKGICGWHKCFFPSLSDKSMGYLVVSHTKYARMKRAARLADKLTRKYGARHFHVDFVRTTVTESFRDFLNTRVEQPARVASGLPATRVYDLNTTRIVLERVVTMPRPNLFIAETRSNTALMERSIRDFHPLIRDRKAFRRQLAEEFQRVGRMLRDNPPLVLDFQAVVDTSGKLFLIDLDGHLSMR